MDEDFSAQLATEMAHHRHIQRLGALPDCGLTERVKVRQYTVLRTADNIMASCTRIRESWQTSPDRADVVGLATITLAETHAPFFHSDNVRYQDHLG